MEKKQQGRGTYTTIRTERSLGCYRLTMVTQDTINYVDFYS